MSFLFYMMDDLRCFFSFFFFVVVLAVGLARDGCLVRSWFGVAQRGGCRRPARERGGFGMASKASHTDSLRRPAAPPRCATPNQLRTKQPSRAKPTASTTTKKKKKNILNHPSCKKKETHLKSSLL